MTISPAPTRARLVKTSGGGYAISPPIDPAGLTGPFVWDAVSALAIPAVSRAVQLFTGMSSQMTMDAWRGAQPLPRPRLLSRPDPDRSRAWFVTNSVKDYILNGNAISYVTSRGVDGWPITVAWLPALWVTMLWENWGAPPGYWFLGTELDPENVVHVRRGADPFYPIRGVGVVEEHLSELDRISMESQYQRSTLSGASVPSVAIISNTAQLTQETADETKATWISKFGGPVREPAILPNGTQVVPLAWSPSDAQLTDARKLSLTDVANMFNIDGYWFGAPVAGMTYKTTGPEYQSLLRTSLEPVLVDFEDVWSDAWLPRGQSIRFDRFELVRDDLATMTAAVVALVTAGIISEDEARAILALPIVAGSETQPLALGSDAAPAPTPGDAPDDANPAGSEGDQAI